MSGQDGQTPGRRRPRAEGLLGGAAQPTAPRPQRERREAPTAVRRAALVVAVEALALTVLALVLLVLTLTGSPDSVGRALAEVVYVGLGAGLLAAAAVGLWRVSGWARGPVIVLQILLGLLGYNAAFEAQVPLLGLPVLALVATELYLLATPEARLAFFER
ncbi:hypothetical protein O2V63_17790 [Modestobacter sp. VKM Ac-2977]|uniref:hypothetical protein n=1 Tax=Modestobacter sp. VKM Ac-2977 TaxID=3004131 RepID=UPI0022AA9135|nr:hypothetical protein [Modestobacter sp. VKM Ac-2977]MCZ2822196.1 hypothetical protein [Modestobacter sp. VKM Ac-2977]